MRFSFFHTAKFSINYCRVGVEQLMLHHVWGKRNKQTRKNTRVAQTLSYYKYAKLMTTVKTRMLTHTKVPLDVLTASER